MDRAALHFISILENTEKDDDGSDKYDITLKMKLFDKGENWLLKRKKLRPEREGEEGEGITDMRAWMRDPDTRAVLKEAMFEEGFVRIPEPKNGRPTSQEAQVRERYHAHKQAKRGVKPEDDDSGWESALQNPTETKQ